MKFPIHYNDLDHLAGIWTKEQAAEFDQALAEQRIVDEGAGTK